MIIKTTTRPSAHLEKLLDQKIKEHNYAIAGNELHQKLAITLKEGNKIIAGILGGIYWDWFYISKLWVDDNYRSQGLGARLLTAAEAEAAKRGCRHIHLDAYSFVADFYFKHGYKVAGKLEGLPPGYACYTLIKELK